MEKKFNVEDFFKDVSNKHPLYVENYAQWVKNRIVTKSAEAVKSAGVTFLPKLNGQDSEEYDAYRMRANFFPAAKKTLASIMGMIHSKAPVVNFPESRKYYLEQIGLDDASISEISMQINYEQALQGRVGILTDYETSITGEIFPYIAVYTAESIWNWKEAKIQGQTRLAMLVLEECVPKDPSNLFSGDTVSQLRVLWLDPDDGFLRVAVLVPDGSKKEGQYSLSEEIRTPTIRGKKLPYIPFLIVGAQSIASGVEESPIGSIVDTNLSHYRTSADLEHGRHYTALPTYYLISDTSEDPKLVVGGGSFIHVKADAQNAEIGMVEYTGAGLSALEKADEQKKQEMAVLGARMLQAEKKQAEAADTVRLRQASENSVIANIARTASRALTISLQWVADMLLLPNKDVSFELTTDFLTISIDPKMVDSLANLVASERMSLETFFYNLAQGGLYPDGHTFEKEMERLSKDSARTPSDKKMPPMQLDDDEEVE